MLHCCLAPRLARSWWQSPRFGLPATELPLQPPQPPLMLMLMLTLTLTLMLTLLMMLLMTLLMLSK